MKKITSILFILVIPLLVFSITAKEVIREVDKQEKFDKMIYDGTMTIKLGDEKRTKEMKSWVIENEMAYVEFINDEDYGTKYLKIKNQLWIYYPNARKSVKIAGHLLKDGMMGSDISYEDTLENRKLLDMYKVKMLGEDTVNNYDCYKIELVAKVKDPTYLYRILWVDKEKKVIVKDEMYSKGGRKLLKVSEVKKIEKFENRWFATKIVVSNKLRKDSSTIFEMKNIQFDVDIPNRIFQKTNLETDIMYYKRF